MIQDHLGNNREVVNKEGRVVQTNNYYPFGMLFCDGTKNYLDQKHKYNGKEFDNMYGLNTYDYGARQYNPVTLRWDRIDPMAEDDPGISPYVYCRNNPIKYIDPTGCKPDSLSAALMSSIVYNSNSDYSKKLASKGWQEYASSSTFTGFKSKTFRKEIGKDKNGNTQYEYCLAFAGTDTSNGVGEFIKDGITDILNAVGAVTPQYVEAIGSAIATSSGIAKNSELTFVGHSLGGGLATLASKLTGKDAIIFNPASITGITKSVANLISSFKGGSITQYRACGDYVNAIQDAIRIPSSGKIHWVNTGSKFSHGLDDIIRTFSK